MNKPKLVTFFLGIGVDPLEKDEDDKSALNWAKAQEHDNIIELIQSYLARKKIDYKKTSVL